MGTELKLTLDECKMLLNVFKGQVLSQDQFDLKAKIAQHIKDYSPIEF